ncbi:cobyrinic acid a,c-diamide synthase [Motilibacter peucedani]|uniref:Hydrogenobyrinate a,c-diamide synthase n=1 Tax=Motilibacter peucedani TaxID=598650 RepID=A0A420XNN6_9ACTN|nr:cobyrinate a,c-diamide synthase [Motilibacter peucedani]RKS73782.1 cobyrinic acid a,c-diamide synthase [Motilibacter peucedani]
MSTPRVVIAAPASGHGKTTVTTGILAALAHRGLAVSPHKVGPDYIDPGYHALAAGRLGRNLDAFLCGEERIVPLFLHGAAGADIAVVEGVMGLYDGASGHGELASTAQVAKLLRAPVVLVVDPSSQGRSVAALVHGFATFDPGVRIGGVILNRVASERHEQVVREALDEIGVPVLGALPRSDAIAAPSRHLGLVPVAERSAASVATVRALGELVDACVDLDAVLDIARTAGSLHAPAWDARVEVGERVEGRPRVALASGAAFTFSYAETAELLTAAGAEVVRVDPLRDEALPEGVQALVVGGGFPEMYAAELSANVPLRTSVRELAATGAPIAAECAGLLYLARSLDGQQMCGVLDVDARMTGQLSLGYRDAVAVTDSVLASEGQRVRGHEFHRTACDPTPVGTAGAPAWRWAGGSGEGFVRGGVHASYLHLHWAGAPHVARRFVAAAAGIAS